jgi:hypothetical protein
MEPVAAGGPDAGFAQQAHLHATDGMEQQHGRFVQRAIGQDW